MEGTISYLGSSELQGPGPDPGPEKVSMKLVYPGCNALTIAWQRVFPYLLVIVNEHEECTQA